MTVEQLQALAGWCTVINFAFLLCWGAILILARDRVYRIHRRWFNLSDDQFDAFHYRAIALYKLLLLMFNLVPYLALRIAF